MPVGKRLLLNTPRAIEQREKVRKRREQGLCSCGELLCSESKTRCIICLVKNRSTQKELRRKIIEHYGNQCNCCGERELKFLALDHIDGGGNLHRLQITGHKKGTLYRWAIKNNFPPIFQVLCHNCNMAKGAYGVCPHKEG